jgi:2,4-dichlorophenol 6-monooxygenase
VDPNGLTLITQGAHDLWAKAIEGVEGVPVGQVRVGEDFVDREGHWGRVCELGVGGALLVRPDQHIAWRARELPADPARALRDALLCVQLVIGGGGV